MTRPALRHAAARTRCLPLVAVAALGVLFAQGAAGAMPLHAPIAATGAWPWVENATSNLTTSALATGTTFPNGCDNLPEVVQFDSSTQGGTPPYAYAWSFGDGTNGTGADPSHPYEVFDTYRVNLTVTDANASVATANFTLEVGFVPCTTLTSSGYSPEAVAALLAALGVGVAAVVVALRRRPRRPAVSDEEWPSVAPPEAPNAKR